LFQILSLPFPLKASGLSTTPLEIPVELHTFLQILTFENPHLLRIPMTFHSLGMYAFSQEPNIIFSILLSAKYIIFAPKSSDLIPVPD